MVNLRELMPRPPWKTVIERCPNCLAKTPDQKALVCDACGFHLRLPKIAILGLVLFAGAIGSFVASVFGGYVLPWPDFFGLTRILEPILGRPTPEDLSNWSFWTGVLLALAGSVATFAGAYSVRRMGDRVRARGGPA